VITLHDILDAMEKGAAHEILGRLARMDGCRSKKRIYADPSLFARSSNALPEGDDKVAGNGTSRTAYGRQKPNGAKHALLTYPRTRGRW